MSTLNIDSTLYRARITLGDLIVPPYPGGELYALDELPDYYPANQAAEVIRAKVVLKLGIHHTDASSVQVAELLTHAQLHERGFSRIAGLRLLEIEAPLGCPTYITPERMSYMFDDPRSVQMWSQLHAGVMLNQVSENVLFRAVVYQLNDVGVARKWLVLLGLPFVYRGDDCDAVFDRLPAMLANCWGVDTDCIDVFSVQLLDECRRSSQLSGVPLAYLWEHRKGSLSNVQLWSDAETYYDLVRPDIAGYLMLVRESLGEEVTR
jgi:hypothetical protein